MKTPIAAVQSEFSLWTRNPELGALARCAELDIAFVAFSPLGRGFLADEEFDPSALVSNDIRASMPRFQAPHVERNQALVRALRDEADDAGCTLAQLALAWVLAQGEHVHAIPGTTQTNHLLENVASGTLALSPEVLKSAGERINEKTVSGERYPPSTQAEVDAENVSAGNAHRCRDLIAGEVGRPLLNEGVDRLLVVIGLMGETLKGR